MAIKKCPLCKKTYDNVDSLSNHIESEHESEIPKDWSGGKYYFFKNNGRTTGKCVICRKDTPFNESTYKTNRFCGNPKCDIAYREDFKKRMMRVHNKVSLLDDAEHQKKMLSNRSIAKDYRWSDGIIKRAIGSYEYDACRFLDVFMQLESGDVYVPAPQVLEYSYDGKTHKYIPDIFIASINLIIEIKDGGDNPNMHHKIQNIDKVKEREKEKAMKNYSYNYIKIENKQYGEFVNLFMKLKNMDEIASKKFEPIIITNEMTVCDQVVPEYSKIIVFRDTRVNLFDEVGLYVNDTIYKYDNGSVITISNNEVIVKEVYIFNMYLEDLYFIDANIEEFINGNLDDRINEVNFPLAIIYEVLKHNHIKYPHIKFDNIYNVSDIKDYSNIKLIMKSFPNLTAPSSMIYNTDDELVNMNESVTVEDITLEAIGDYDHYIFMIADIYNSNRRDFISTTNDINTTYAMKCLDIIDAVSSLKDANFCRQIFSLDTCETEIRLKALSLLLDKENAIRVLDIKHICSQPLLASPNLLNIHRDNLNIYDTKYNSFAERTRMSISSGMIDYQLISERDNYLSKLDETVSDEELYYLGIKPI